MGILYIFYRHPLTNHTPECAKRIFFDVKCNKSKVWPKQKLNSMFNNKNKGGTQMIIKKTRIDSEIELDKNGYQKKTRIR